ncbi:TatD family hydrolase [Neisseriaceae bacterium ESL0693]|nr:TatD family hydrolase [Neisseriaceae bacterium ESL0693]
MCHLFDTHCHLTHPPLRQQLPQILTQAALQKVTRFLVPATGPEDWSAIIRLKQQYRSVSMALGIHPWYIKPHHKPALECLIQHLVQHPDALVGEIGLDFHVAKEDKAKQNQKIFFEDQLSIARQYQRPVVIHHVRASFACIDSIQRCGFKYGGFAHAFSGSVQEAQKWHQLGFMVGIGSLLLNPKAQKIRRTVAELPLDYMVLETDAPYMAPDKGVNYPANTRRIAEIVAQLRHCDWQEVASQCYQNACRYVEVTQ